MVVRAQVEADDGVLKSIDTKELTKNCNENVNISESLTSHLLWRTPLKARANNPNPSRRKRATSQHLKDLENLHLGVNLANLNKKADELKIEPLDFTA